MPIVASIDKGPAMLLTAMQEYFTPGSCWTMPGCELRMLPVRLKPAFLGLANTVEAAAYVRLDTNEIAFREAADRILSAVGDALPGKKGRIRCNWFVCSESGGIYLYEAIAVKDHTRFKNMINRFVVVNSINGTVSFGPGHIENTPYSRRLAEVLGQCRTTPRDLWERRMFDIFDGMQGVLGR